MQTLGLTGHSLRAACAREVMHSIADLHVALASIEARMAQGELRVKEACLAECGKLGWGNSFPVIYRLAHAIQ